MKLVRYAKSLPKFIILLCMMYAFSHADDPTIYHVKCGKISGSVYLQSESFFSLESADLSFSLPATANQSIVEDYLIKGKKLILIKTGDAAVTDTDDDRLKSLLDTRFLNLDSPEIQKAAQSISVTGDLLFNVENFVRRNISVPATGIPFLPAAAILKQGTGDCTEHAILTISLLRSLHVPARGVMGMVLVRDFGVMKNVFVYHMWAEAFYRGRWRLVDSTSPGEHPMNRYIAFAYHSLRTEAPLSYLKALSSIRNLKLTYLK